MLYCNVTLLHIFVDLWRRLYSFLFFNNAAIQLESD